MSASEPNFDQLLSDHLDGRLDHADAQMLEQSMREDPALKSQFDAMRRDRQDLRELFAAQQSAGPRLGRDFAAHVLAESHRRGLRTGGAEGSAEGIATTKQSDPAERFAKPVAAMNWQRVAMVSGLIATAAAVLLVVSLSFRGNQMGNNDGAIAHKERARSFDSAGGDSPKPQPISPSVEIASSAAEIASEAAGEASDSMIASADQAESTLDVQPQELQEDLEKSPSSPAGVAAMPSPGSLLDRAAAVSVDNDGSLRNGSLRNGPQFNVAMMVYEVRLSPQGRRMDVLSEAMQRVGLQDARRLPVNRDVIAAAKRADTFDEDAQFRVLFLQASAKKIDRLLLSLQRDTQSVEAVRHSLVTDAPLMQLANDLTRVDATKIQHDSPLSLELTDNDSEELATLRELLSDQPFVPMVSSERVPPAESLSTTGNDFTTSVLILVR